MLIKAKVGPPVAAPQDDDVQQWRTVLQLCDQGAGLFWNGADLTICKIDGDNRDEAFRLQLPRIAEQLGRPEGVGCSHRERRACGSECHDGGHETLVTSGPAQYPLDQARWSARNGCGELNTRTRRRCWTAPVRTSVIANLWIALKLTSAKVVESADLS